MSEYAELSAKVKAAINELLGRRSAKLKEVADIESDLRSLGWRPGLATEADLGLIRGSSAAEREMMDKVREIERAKSLEANRRR